MKKRSQKRAYSIFRLDYGIRRLKKRLYFTVKKCYNLSHLNQRYGLEISSSSSSANELY
jgi:hypothetical protein